MMGRLVARKDVPYAFGYADIYIESGLRYATHPMQTNQWAICNADTNEMVVCVLRRSTLPKYFPFLCLAPKTADMVAVDASGNEMCSVTRNGMRTKYFFRGKSVRFSHRAICPVWSHSDLFSLRLSPSGEVCFQFDEPTYLMPLLGLAFMTWLETWDD